MSRHLLSYNSNTEGIIKLILEKIVMGNPLFLSEIKDNNLYTSDAHIDLYSDINTVEQFIRQEFHIPLERIQWKDIRKQSVKNYLLHKYSADKRELLFIHLKFANKTITNDSIKLGRDHFSIETIE